MSRRIVMFGLLVIIALGGCADMAAWQARTIWGLDCRPEQRQPDGQCTRTSAQ